MSEFTAVSDCPRCGDMAVHWIEPVRLCPPEIDPADTLVTTFENGDEMHMTSGVGAYFDDPGAAVARRCVKCNHRWTQR